MRRAILVVAGLLGFAISSPAQDPFTLTTGLPQIGSDSLLLRNSPIALADGRYLLPRTAMRSMGMVSLDFLPVYLSDGQPHPRPATRRNVAESPLPGRDDLVSPGIYSGGEVGFYYGHSAGKWSGDEFGSYIFGTVGDDRFQVTAGASYQESNFHFPRGR